MEAGKGSSAEKGAGKEKCSVEDGFGSCAVEGAGKANCFEETGNLSAPDKRAQGWESGVVTTQCGPTTRASPQSPSVGTGETNRKRPRLVEVSPKENLYNDVVKGDGASEGEICRAAHGSKALDDIMGMRVAIASATGDQEPSRGYSKEVPAF